MDNLTTWMAMGGYSMYVWASYALAFGVFSFTLWTMRRARKVAHYHLQQWFKKMS